MNEEELKERLLEIIAVAYSTPYPLIIDRILTLFREAGWKSGEEVKKDIPLRKVRWGWCVKPNTTCEGPDCEGCEFLRV